MKKLIILFSLLFALPASASFDKDLFYGITGDPQVSELQEFLTEQGVYQGPITSNFFSLTLSGVKNFQIKEGITPISGYFGPISRGKANAILSSTVPVSETQLAEIPIIEIAPTSSDIDMVADLQRQIAELQKQLIAMLSQQQIMISQPTPATTEPVAESTPIPVQETAPVSTPETQVIAPPEPVVEEATTTFSLSDSIGNAEIKDGTTTVYNSFVYYDSHPFKNLETGTLKYSEIPEDKLPIVYTGDTLTWSVSIGNMFGAEKMNNMFSINAFIPGYTNGKWIELYNNTMDTPEFTCVSNESGCAWGRNENTWSYVIPEDHAGIIYSVRIAIKWADRSYGRTIYYKVLSKSRPEVLTLSENEIKVISATLLCKYDKIARVNAGTLIGDISACQEFLSLTGQEKLDYVKNDYQL